MSKVKYFLVMLGIVLMVGGCGKEEIESPTEGLTTNGISTEDDLGANLENVQNESVEIERHEGTGEARSLLHRDLDESEYSFGNNEYNDEVWEQLPIATDLSSFQKENVNPYAYQYMKERWPWFDKRFDTLCGESLPYDFIYYNSTYLSWFIQDLGWYSLVVSTDESKDNSDTPQIIYDNYNALLHWSNANELYNLVGINQEDYISMVKYCPDGLDNVYCQVTSGDKNYEWFADCEDEIEDALGEDCLKTWLCKVTGGNNKYLLLIPNAYSIPYYSDVVCLCKNKIAMEKEEYDSGITGYSFIIGEVCELAYDTNIMIDSIGDNNFAYLKDLDCMHYPDVEGIIVKLDDNGSLKNYNEDLFKNVCNYIDSHSDFTWLDFIIENNIQLCSAETLNFDDDQELEFQKYLIDKYLGNDYLQTCKDIIERDMQKSADEESKFWANFNDGSTISINDLDRIIDDIKYNEILLVYNTDLTRSMNIDADFDRVCILSGNTSISKDKVNIYYSDGKINEDGTLTMSARGINIISMEDSIKNLNGKLFINAEDTYDSISDKYDEYNDYMSYDSDYTLYLLYEESRDLPIGIFITDINMKPSINTSS